MDVKVTFFFEAMQQATRYASAALGWTETFYASSTHVGSLDAWIEDSASIHDYVYLRRACLPSIYRIPWVRVSDEANVRNYKVRALENTLGTAHDTTGTPGNMNEYAQVTCALLVDLVKLGGVAPDFTHHRRFLMRGLPIDVVRGNIVVTNGINWPSIRNFFNWLAFSETGTPQQPDLTPGVSANTQMGLRYQNPLFLTRTPSPAVATTVGNSRTITVSDTLPGTPGVSKYAFAGFPSQSRSFNKTWTLLATTAGPPGSSVLGTARRPLVGAPAYTPPNTGTYRLVVPVYGLFTQYTIIGLRVKKTGRLFRLPRGRSSSR